MFRPSWRGLQANFFTSQEAIMALNSAFFDAVRLSLFGGPITGMMQRMGRSCIRHEHGYII